MSISKESQERFCAIRRDIIAWDLRHLNPMQCQAAMTVQGALLVLAGAGTGKTTVLIQRIYNLLTYGEGSESSIVSDDITDDDLHFLERFYDTVKKAEEYDGDMNRIRQLCAVNVPKPWEILAITFTNKAAGEIKERLAARLGTRSDYIWASTFHSACVRILRRYIDRLGFDRNFTIYDADDSQRVVRDILKELNIDTKTFTPKAVLSTISSAKNLYQDAEEFSEEYTEKENWRMSRIAVIYRAYVRELRAANALDFDDLIFFTVKLLEQEPDVLQYYQNQFRYVLVDEYQDTNHLQYILTSLLAGGHKNLCVVGDDDQSIYRFRGADIKNILSFEKQYPTARVIRLEQNYRSTQNILDVANAVIQNNTERKGKNLWTKNDQGTAVRVRTSINESGEAEFVADEILSAVQQGGKFKDHAILYRMNAQSNALEYAMRRNGIPYRIIGGTKFFDRMEVKDMLAYLCVFNNPMDDLRLKRIINKPARGIGVTTLNKVTAIAEKQGASLYEILRNADLFSELKNAKTKLLKLADMIDDMRSLRGQIPLDEFYDVACKVSGYVKALEEKNDTESQGRLENVLELKSSILEFLRRNPPDATLSGFLNEIALYTDLDSAAAVEDCVTMMTVHAAKGLEFSSVYVVGLEEGIFPLASYRPEDIEEERRLCYVAITRARKRLILSNAYQRMLYGYTNQNDPSRFLREIPIDRIEWEDFSSFYTSSDSSYGYNYNNLQRGGNPRNFNFDVDSYSDKDKTQRVQIMASKNININLRTTDKNTEKSSLERENSLQLSSGDKIEHSTFGIGHIISMRPISGDTVLEVHFETVGDKTLMLKYAKAYLKKL